MIFSSHTVSAAQAGFENRLHQAGDPIRQSILARLHEANLSAASLTALQWIYANSPLSDLANYDFDLFLSCARHGVFLREHSPYAKELPEDIFLNYVLHPRVNEEELCDCRPFFYQQLAPRLQNLPQQKAILAANYWNAEQVTYQSTDSRTISALGAYRSGYGRCGEESVFAVNVFRSVGIAARQIYTPRWAHCDDNHAWVEVWCNGGWHFLGACEPEELLDRGWFTNAASRAMLIHSRCFGEISGEEVISKVGMASFLNHLSRYGAAKRLTVRVINQDGAPQAGVPVTFGIYNYSEFFPAATVTTGPEGEAAITCGLGSILVRAQKCGLSCERLVFVPDVAEPVLLTLTAEPPATEVWEDFTVAAPKDRPSKAAKPTQEQKALCLEKTAAARAQRESRVASLYREDEAAQLMSQYGYSDKIADILKESRGNFENLLAFLREPAANLQKTGPKTGQNGPALGQNRPVLEENDTVFEEKSITPEEKEAILASLSPKDWRDVDPSVLEEALEFALPYREQAGELFYPYVACPRVANEPLRPNRRFITEYFSEKQRQAFRQNPGKIWKYIQAHIDFDPALEYGQIVTLPAAALAVKNASPRSQRILFVAICRALGIPARLNPATGEPEFYSSKKVFVPVEQQEDLARGAILLEKAPGESWQYYTDFTLSRLVKGEWKTLNFAREPWRQDVLRLELPAGDYRIFTSARRPDGSVQASRYRFHLDKGEEEKLMLHRQEILLSQMLNRLELEEFYLKDEAGIQLPGSALSPKGAVFLWLEEGAEPTEHLLNEMLEQADKFAKISDFIYFIVRGKEALLNPKLQKVRQSLPGIRVYYDSFVPNVETIGRRMYVDHEKLPLILLTDGPLQGIYACSGYQVGSGSLILQIWDQV